MRIGDLYQAGRSRMETILPIASLECFADETEFKEYQAERMRKIRSIPTFTLLGFALLTVGCSAGLQPVCRHTSLMCALVMQEKYRDVQVAFGPVIHANREVDPLISHAQTRVLVDGKWIWVNYAGGACHLTDIKENFLDLNHYSVEMFYAWLWKSPATATNAPPPTMSLKDSISIEETGRFR
jgi:hypothetical protein